MIKKLLAVGSVTALLVSLSLFADEEPVIEQLTPEQEIKIRKVGEEITSLRKANIKVTKADNGQLRAKVFTRHIHYFDDADSTWKKPDFTVHEISVLEKLNPLRKWDKYVNIGENAAIAAAHAFDGQITDAQYEEVKEPLPPWAVELLKTATNENWESIIEEALRTTHE